MLFYISTSVTYEKATGLWRAEFTDDNGVLAVYWTYVLRKAEAWIRKQIEEEQEKNRKHIKKGE
jgi:hypothetical protein